MIRVALVVSVVGAVIGAGRTELSLRAAAQEQFGADVNVLHLQVFVDSDTVPWPTLSLDHVSVAVDGEERPVIDINPVDAAQADRVAALERVDAGTRGGVRVERLSETGLPSPARRRFLIFFDLARMSRPGLRNGRRAALQFLRERVTETDYVGLTLYSPRRGLEHVIPMTTNRTLLLEALGGLDSARAAERYDPVAVGIPIEEFARLASAESNEAPVPTQEEFIRQIEESRVELEAETMLSALGQTSRDLQAVDGPTHVLLFSRGLPDGVLADAGARRELERAVEEAEAAGVVLHTLQPDNLPGSNVHDPQHMQSRWQPGSARRSASFPEWFIMRDRAVLHFLAGETGGRSAFYRHSLSRELNALEEETRRYYLLAVQLTGDEPDGASLDVRVRAPDVTVRWAPRRLEMNSGDRLSRGGRALKVAEALDLRYEVSRLPVEHEAVAFASGRGLKLGVWLEIGSATIRQLAVDVGGEQLGFEVLGMLSTRWGAVVDHFRTRVRLRADLDIAVAPNSEPVRYYDELDLEAGEYFVKLLVRETATGSLFSRSLKIAVPPDDGALRMSGPVVVEPLGGRALINGAGDGATAGSAAHPLTVDGMILLPTVRPERYPGEQLELFVEAGRVARDPRTASFRLNLDVALATALAPPTRLRPTVERRESRPDGFERLLLRVRVPESLRPDNYSLVVSLEDAVAGATATGETLVRVLARR